jgi:hypothetical protein
LRGGSGTYGYDSLGESRHLLGMLGDYQEHQGYVRKIRYLI